jgi:uncharacterized protein YjiS (DUF1127 family)
MTLARAIGRAFSRLGRERRIRSDIGALMTFDDCLLKDIGISRSDIDAVSETLSITERNAVASMLAPKG